TGNGTSASPWVPPTNGTLGVRLNPGATPYTAITAATASLDGGAPTTLSSPWIYTWPDPGDYGNHTLTFTVTTTCTQTLAPVYLQGSLYGCHLQTFSVDSTVIAIHTPAETGSDYEIDLTLKNLSTDPVTVNTIIITDSVPKKGHWNYLELPSGTKTQTASASNLPADGGNSGAVNYTKTFNLTSAATGDRTSGASTSRVYKLLYTSGSGGTAVTATNISGVTVTMTTVAGGSGINTCGIR
ncbi:MAG: hypothetical protein ACREMY_14970, partial [bacterium]